MYTIYTQCCKLFGSLSIFCHSKNLLLLLLYTLVLTSYCIVNNNNLLLPIKYSIHYYILLGNVPTYYRNQ